MPNGRVVEVDSAPGIGAGLGGVIGASSIPNGRPWSSRIEAAFVGPSEASVGVSGASSMPKGRMVVGGIERSSPRPNGRPTESASD